MLATGDIVGYFEVFVDKKWPLAITIGKKPGRIAPSASYFSSFFFYFKSFWQPWYYYKRLISFISIILVFWKSGRLQEVVAYESSGRFHSYTCCGSILSLVQILFSLACFQVWQCVIMSSRKRKDILSER